MGGLVRTLIVLIAIAASLAACGGGGGGGSSGGSSGNSSSSSLSVALASTSGSASATESSAASLGTTATITGTVPSGAVVDLQYDSAVLASGTATAGAAGIYTISAQTKSDLAPGTYTGTLTFRLCKEAACTTVYPGSTATYAYTVDIKLRDWQTYQRDAAHTGFVNMSYDPTKFSQSWSWTGNGYLFPMATGNSLVYVSSNEAANGNYDAKVYAIKASDGTVAWSYDKIGRAHV